MTWMKPVAVAAACLLSLPAHAQKLTEDNVESRFLLALQADSAAIQKRLPADLEVSPYAAGPLKDMNLLIVLYERHLQLDGAAKQVPANMHGIAVVAAAVKSRTTGKPGVAVLRAFYPREELVPGFYKSGVLASIDREVTTRMRGIDGGTVKDEWHVKTRTGDQLDVHVEYARSTPTRSQREAQIFSIAQPNLFRIYRWDETTELVRSVPANVNRATKLEYRVAISDMGDLFGPETRTIAALASPVFLRKVLVPEQLAAQ